MRYAIFKGMAIYTDSYNVCHGNWILGAINLLGQRCAAYSSPQPQVWKSENREDRAVDAKAKLESTTKELKALLGEGEFIEGRYDPRLSRYAGITLTFAQLDKLLAKVER